MADEVLHFAADARFDVAGRGVVFTGPCPWDLRDRAEIPYYHGRCVEIGGALWRIVAFETFAKLPGPSIGEGIGLLVQPL